MKSGYQILSLCVGIWAIAGCGYDFNKASGGAGASSEAEKIFFKVSDYPQETIYSLDVTNNYRVNFVNTKSGEDLALFYGVNPAEPNAFEHYIAKRLYGYQPSVLLKYSSPAWELGNTAASLPFNVYNLIYSQDKTSIVLIGNAKGELALADKNGKVLKSSFSVGGLQQEDGNKNLVGASLASSGNLFVVSGGDYFSGKTQARVHKLIADYSAVEKSYDIPNCANITNFRALSQSSFIVGCNPQYDPDVNDFVKLVKVDTVSGVPNFTTIKEQQSDAFLRGFEITGIANLSSGQAVFVEELGSYSTSGVSVNKRYWYELVSAKTTEIKTYGGQFFYDQINRVYIFSCVAINAAECKTNKFAVVKEEDVFKDKIAKEIDIDISEKIELPKKFFNFHFPTVFY